MVMATGAAIAHSNQSEAATGAEPLPANASVAHLKVKGTAMVASLAASSSAMAPSTRSLRSLRSAGQMWGRGDGGPPCPLNIGGFWAVITPPGENPGKIRLYEGRMTAAHRH